MKKGWPLLIGLLLLLGIASYATTRVLRQPEPPPATGLDGFVMLQDYLGLSQQQRQAIAAIDAESVQGRDKLRNDVWAARDDLRKILNDPSSTSAQAISAARRLGEAQQRLQVNTIEYTYELRKHLTPGQKEKLAATMDRGMCALMGGPGMRKGCGMGNGNCGMSGPGGRPGGPRCGR